MKIWKIAENSKTHPDPWTMTLEELRSFEIPKFQEDREFHIGYHITSLDNVDSILSSGLLISKARGKLYGEPNWIWAYLNEEIARKNHNTYVIFKANKKDEFVDQPNEISIRLIRDVSISDILYVVKGYKFEVGGFIFERYIDEFKTPQMETSYKLMIQWAKERNNT